MSVGTDNPGAGEQRETANAAQSPSNGRWWDRKSVALAELAIVLLIFLADWKHLIPLSKTPFILVLGWASLRARKIKWRDIGLARFRNWGTTLALGGACGLGMELLQLFVTQPLLVWLTGKPPDLSDFRDVTGNIKLLLLFLALVWTLAAFGEEMVYRGYLMNRVADLGGRTRGAWIASLILVHTFFGFAHAYQGITGVIDEGLMGLLLGVMYLGSGRNLAVPIVAHGAQDTIDMLLIYLGKYPGM